MKTAVETVFVGKNRLYNRRFLQMCSHYLVDPVACTLHLRATIAVTASDKLLAFLTRRDVENQCAPGTLCCGFVPLRQGEPLSSRGSSPLTLDMKELPDAIHREIDQETVAWA